VPRVACIGECMIELREQANGQLTRGFGGDTLNTAIYLARLGVSVDYATALGDDRWSDEMLASWKAEGVGTDLVVRLPGRLPGLYVIQTDDKGERRFSYWRANAPARDLFALPETDALCHALVRYNLIYFSGITLSLYGEHGRERLFEAIERCRASGCRIAFDTNFRPSGWPDRSSAKSAYYRAFGSADILLASQEDLELLFGNSGAAEFETCLNIQERILKLQGPACRVAGADIDTIVETSPVAPVDTTAAGDSFAAAYLAARLADRSIQEAARIGHWLAGIVVCHPGAIIPSSAMPEKLRSELSHLFRENSA
jgi:2-dehydro-3-deoxygluconokinase